MENNFVSKAQESVKRTKNLSHQELEILVKVLADEAVQEQLEGLPEMHEFSSIWQGFCQHPALTGSQVNAETNSKA